MTNPLKIYSGLNALLYTTPVNTGCRRRVQLMNEDSITVKFSDKTKMKFPVGTRIGDFYITKEQQEKYNATTGGYDYELKFDAYYWLWANRLLFYVMPGVTNAPKETSFKLTATIDVHAAVILRALNALGFTYDGSPFRVDTDEGFSTEAKYISYANMSILGGIQAIADAYECEWWVAGNSIHFGKCNAIGEYDFTVGENVASITSDSKTTPANRLVVFGSTRNLPPNYRTPESSDVVDAVVVKRLMLPEGTPYLQTSPDIPEDEIVEEEVVLDSVYPRTALSVTDVETYDSTAQDGNTQTFYRIKYGTAFHFSKDYILPDEELHVVFESGDLNGMDFAVKFNPLGLAEKKDDGSINPDAQMFEIVANEDYGRSLPDTVLHPAKTDKFSLYGWDSTKMEALGLLAAAEQELLTEGNKLLDEYRKDKQTYTCPMMWDWCKEQAEEGNSPRLGSVVNLHFVAGDTGRKSRIIGFEHDLDIEYSNVTYICGEKVSVSRLKTLESKVEGLTHDGTKVKVQNSLDFLSKRYSDRTPYQLASDIGFDVGQFLASVSGGRFGIDKVTGQSFLEVDRIFARVRAYFESLTVVERESLAGEQMVTPGGGVKCTSVEEMRNGQNVLTGWRCYFLSEQDGEKRETKIKAGDQAIAQTFNAKVGTTNKVSNHRWWRLVTGVSNNAYTDDSGNIYGYIEVSATDCETDSDTPKEGDEIVQFGNRTDKARQAAILISTVASDAPSIKLLTGIDHYSLSGKDIISQGYDAAKGHAYFRCYGDTYIGAPDGSTYVKYDVDSKKLTVKADLEVGSTIGGKDAEDFVKDLIPEIPELTQEDIEGFVNNIVNPKIEGIQDQIDGVIETWFYNGVPTLSNYPASGWNTDALKAQHLGDLYYDNDTGTAYRFSQKADKSYYWNVITDDAITKALAAAQKAQDTADGKRRTFTSQPTPPYDKGDIWVNATYPAGNTAKDPASGKYHNDILRCNTSRATGSFAIGDWGLASNYTDDTAALAAAQAAQAAKNAADAAQSAANAAQSSVTSLNNYVNGAFKDGIIDETEASGIANYINIVNADKERIDGTYQTLYANAYLSATGKAALKTAHDDVAAKITALINAINSAIADNKVTAAESAAVDSAFSAFSTSNKAFSAAVETANEEIQQTLKSAADAAKTAADNAKAAADAAKGVADAAKDRLDSWAADGVISPTEKQAIKDEIARIDADKAHIAAEYTRYSLGTPTDYNAAHSAYRAQLVTLSASTPENITIPSDFTVKQTAYYNQRTAALSAIATAAKKYADDVAKEEAAKATDAYKYLKESLLNAQQESTEISGGLILSTMMALGYTENGVKKILSGMNGSYVSSLGGRTIASWYGGHMLDLFDKNDNRIANPTGQEATSLIRMDGSFYFANGNIGGRTDGSGWLAGDNITWDASGAITFGNGIHIDLGSGNSTTLGGLNSKLSGVETTVGSVLTLVNALSNVLVPVNSSGARVAWDSADLFAVKSVKGFYSEEFISARGLNGQSSSISKYLTDLLDVGISAPASGQALVYNGSKWVNQAIQTGLDTTQLANYLTTNNYAKKSDIPSLTPYLKVDGSNGTAAGLTAMINKLSPGDANITDSTMLVTSHATTPDGNNYYRRSATYLWGYIKGKADSVYATSGHTHNVIINGETKTISATGAPAVNLGTFLTAHQSLANYVTTNTAQTITATKTFSTSIVSNLNTSGSWWISTAVRGKFMATNGGTAQDWSPVLGFKTVTGKYEIGSLNDTGYINYYHDTRTSNGADFQLIIPKATGTLATQEWVTGAYVKKAGDTMSGALGVLNLRFENSNEINLNGSGRVCIGYRNTPNGVNLCYQNTPLTYGSAASTIWHSGNDGSGSGLDADLLDGVHNGDLTARTFKLLRYSSSTSDTSNLAIIKQHYTEIPVEAPCTLGLLHGSISMAFGWRLGGSYNSVSSAYCGWFISDYGTPRWIGADAGTWKSETFAFLSSTVANANSLGGKAASLYVTTDTAQTISGAKTFTTNYVKIQTLLMLKESSATKGIYFAPAADGYLAICSHTNYGWTANLGFIYQNGSLEMKSFVKSGGTSSQFLKADGSVDSNSYLTTGSAASIYLPKTGGTIKNGATTVPLIIDSDSTSEVGLKFNKSGASKAWVGYDSLGARIYNYACGKGVGVKDNGTLYFQSDIVWHAGNDGSGSGLDADLLDGVHLSSIMRESVLGKGDKNADSLSTAWVIYRPGHDMNTDNGAWTNFPTTKPAGGFSLINLQSGYYKHQIFTQYFDNHLYVRNTRYDSGPIVWSGWATLALTTDNVASATKLQTARTIWGQSFDGSANVSGNMTGVGSITMNGDLVIDKSAPIIKLKGRENGSTIQFYASDNTYRASIQFQNNYGPLEIKTGSEDIYLVPGKNVRVKTSTSTCALNCASFICDSWVRSKGATGWYNESYGGGWYMTDSTWIRNYGNKALYMNSATIRTDYQFDRQGYAGSSWNYGYGAYNVAITDNENQTPLMVAYRAGQSSAVTGADRLFALELLNTGTTLNFAFGGAMKFSMTNGGVFRAIGGIYSDGYVSARGQNTSSDERLKNILRPLSLNVRDIANAPSVEFVWKKDGIKDVGSIAQYWRKLIPQLAPDMPDGSMGLQYGKTALMSVIAVARKTVSLEERITQLERENRELKAQISQLKTQLV